MSRKEKIILSILAVGIILIGGWWILGNQKEIEKFLQEIDCAKAGESSSHPSLGPKAPTPRKCCEGLVEIYTGSRYEPDKEYADKHGCTHAEGAGNICSDCGNGICESWENRCNCPKDCREAELLSEKTCSEECKERGWDYGICRSWTSTDDLWGCKYDELDIRDIHDCYVPSGTVGKSKTCCCGGSIEKECAKAGEEIFPVEHRKGVRCCEGLVGIGPARFHHPCNPESYTCENGCTVPPPYEIPWVQCSPCSNEICESGYGENKCNCPEDCKEKTELFFVLPKGMEEWKIGATHTIEINQPVEDFYPFTHLTLNKLDGEEVGMISCKIGTREGESGETIFNWDTKTVLNYCGAGLEEKIKEIEQGTYIIAITKDVEGRPVMASSEPFSIVLE